MSAGETERDLEVAGADALSVLASELRHETAVIAAHVRDAPGPARLGALVAAGPAVAGTGGDYATVFEAVREGYLLHFDRPRIVRPPDEDLALLAGDFLYAKGLERLAALGDLASVRELSDLIALSAQLHARAGDRRSASLADLGALWLASAVAIAVGPGDEHERAKGVLREQGSGRPLYAVAARSAEAAGLDEQLCAAAETVGFSPPDRG
jgi:hypothetical protein